MLADRTELRSRTFAPSTSDLGAELPVPGPVGRHLLGCLLEIRRDRLSFVTHATEKYGDFICFRMGSKRIYLLSHASYAKHVLCDNVANYRKGLGLAEAKPLLGDGLLTSDGELWASQRRLLQAAFTNQRMEQFSSSMVDATRRAVEKWRPSEHQTLDVAREMIVLTLAIVGSTLFRMDLTEDADDLSRDLTRLAQWSMARMTSFWRLPMLAPTPANRSARRALKRLEVKVDEMIRSPNFADDDETLISMLMAGTSKTGAPLSKKLVRDEIMTLLLAGHETTAATLTWTWYLLSQYPEVERRLQAEVDEVIGGGVPKLAHLTQLTYTRMVVSEALRLFPPVWLLPRKTIHADRLDGHIIPANSDVLICVYSLHRHPDFWPHPEKFDPQRFTADQCAQRSSCAYLPFGAGPRTCLGSRFGLMEVMLVVAVIAQRFCLRLRSNHRVEPEASLTLHPRHGMPMNLYRRGSSLAV